MEYVNQEALDKKISECKKKAKQNEELKKARAKMFDIAAREMINFMKNRYNTTCELNIDDRQMQLKFQKGNRPLPMAEFWIGTDLNKVTMRVSSFSQTGTMGTCVNDYLSLLIAEIEVPE